jgi:hypothetical protein
MQYFKSLPPSHLLLPGNKIRLYTFGAAADRRDEPQNALAKQKIAPFLFPQLWRDP